MPAPLLSIGLAHFDDFAGLYPTIQSLRLNNPDLMSHVEFVVIDNSPEDHATAAAIRDLLAAASDHHPARYVPWTKSKGTAAPRDAIFNAATGDYVLVLDCHVELKPGGLDALLTHYMRNPDCPDILSGPLLMDNLRAISTHFDPIWRGGMFGTWGAAWTCAACADRLDAVPARFAIVEIDGHTAARSLTFDPQPVKTCPTCNRSIPRVTWPGHEARLTAARFRPLGLADDEPPFEIPGMGLGLFSCRRDRWPGFNPHAVGFGGEELYIHEKFRRAGGRALCLPALKWVHRFYRKGGSNYPNSNYWKCRNYVLEWNELGLPLDPIRRHFCEDPADRTKPDSPPLLTPAHWDDITADPINHTTDRTAERAALRAAVERLPPYPTVEALFEDVERLPRDLDQHMRTFRALAAEAAGTVCEITARRESTIGFLAGRPKALFSFSTELDPHTHRAAELVADTTTWTAPPDYVIGAIVADLPENDCLFVDTFHRYGHLTNELAAYGPKCRRFIVLHDTEIYGERGDDGSLGLRFAIAEFVAKNPPWRIIDHSPQQYGLTILSRLEIDWPAEPVTGFHLPSGPGTELKKILETLGIKPAANCSCNSRAAQMDAWGPDGCEAPENLETITGWLRDGTWTGLDMAAAVTRSLFTGLAFELNPLKPFESLARLAIKRARDHAART